MFAAIWTRERFGPAVGSLPAAMYTSIRYPFPVTLGDEALGDFTIALCGLRFGEHDAWLEGRPIALDRTIETTWPSEAQDTATLRAAVEALRSASFHGLAGP